MEMEKMIELIDAVSKSDLTGFKYEEDGIKLHLSKKENTCYVTETSDTFSGKRCKRFEPPEEIWIYYYEPAIWGEAGR